MANISVIEVVMKTIVWLGTLRFRKHKIMTCCKNQTSPVWAKTIKNNREWRTKTFENDENDQKTLITMKNKKRYTVKNDLPAKNDKKNCQKHLKPIVLWSTINPSIEKRTKLIKHKKQSKRPITINSDRKWSKTIKKR